MKKIINSLFVIVASMVTFAGCQKEENNAPAAGETKTVQFFANSIETKTAFGTPDGKTYPTLWTENDEQVKILLNLNEEAVADVEISDDFTTASFIADVELSKTKPSVSPYQFAVISPATAYLGKPDARFAVTIPTTQTPLVNSVDEAAQILYAVSESYEQIPGSVNLVFKHFTAYGNLSFTNLSLGDAQVTSVAITSSVDFAGRWNYKVETGTFEENSGALEITLNTNSTENLWFACAPIGDMNGKELTFTINTNKGTLSKTVTLSGDKYKFEAGKIAKMTVNMAGIEFAKSKVYELVTSADDLTPESEIIIVATDYDLALSTTQNKNNRGPAAIDKSDDKSTISDPGSGVQVIVLEEGTVDGTFAFNVANGYLYAPGNDNHLKTTESLNENASWNISISSEGLATIKAAITGEKNWMRYNKANSLFSCYASGQTDVSIYKRQGTGTTPLPKLTVPVVTAELSEDKTSIAVSWDAVEYATSYEISGVGDDVTTNETSYTFTEIEPKTYNITVKAVADGYRSSTSTAVSVVVPNVESGDEGEDESGWVSTAFADLKDGDQVVIVSTKGSNIFAMSNNNGTGSAPAAVAVEYSNDKLSSEPEAKLVWTVEISGSNYIFHPGSDNNTWLYCTSTNNGVRVGTNANKTFVMDTSGYLKHVATSRYLGVYDNQDWRCYTNTTGNTAGQTFKFFVKKGSSADSGETPVDPTPDPEPEPDPTPDPEPDQPGQGGDDAELKTSSLVLASSKKFGTTSGSTLNADDSQVWKITTISGGAIQNQFNTSYQGQQIGTTNSPWVGTFTSDFSGKNIKSVMILANTGEKASLSVTVGNVDFGTKAVTKNTSNALEYLFEGSASGNVTIKVSDTKKAFYLGAIVVTYN